MKKRVMVILVSCLFWSGLIMQPSTSYADNNLYNTNGAKASVVSRLAESAVFLLHNLIRSTWNPNLETDSPVWRNSRDSADERELLLRHDSRSPDSIFHEGFRPRNDLQSPYNFVWNLQNYAAGRYRNRDNPYVSTTRPTVDAQGRIVQQWTPNSFYATTYVYEIFAPGGIDINASLGNGSPYPEQAEIAFPGGIRREFIRSVRVYGDRGMGELVEIITNPHFQGQSNLPEITIPDGVKVRSWAGDNHSLRNISDIDTKDDSDPIDPMKVPGTLKSDPYANKPRSKQLLPDGEYNIGSSIDTNVIVDLSENKEGGLVHAYQYLGSSNQQWIFTYHKNKQAYKISSSNNKNLVMTWDTNSQDNKIKGYTNNDYNDKYWQLELTSDGYYTFKNLYDTTKRLDLNGGSTSDRSKITMSNQNGKLDQKWKITPIATYQPFSDGEYRIGGDSDIDWVSALMENKEGGIVSGGKNLWNDNSSWEFTYSKEKKAYKISNSQNKNLVMTWDKSSQPNLVRGNGNSNRNEQYWRVEVTSDGNYYLKTFLNSSMVLSSRDGLTPKSKVYVLPISTGSEWKITPTNYQPILDGSYKIGSSINNNVVVDLSENKAGGLVYAYQYLGLPNQQWTFTYHKDKKAYKISSDQNTNLLLTWDTNTGIDRLIKGYNNNNTLDKYWRIEPTEKGYYKLRNLNDPEYRLNLNGGVTTDTTRISMAKSPNYWDTVPDGKWDLASLKTEVLPSGEYQISTKLNYKKVVDMDSGEQHINIYDNMNMATSYWKLNYDSSKKAYKIYTSKYQNQGLVYQSRGMSISVDNIDGMNSNELRVYWTIEYDPEKGGYLIRSLYDPTQVFDVYNNNTNNAPFVISKQSNNSDNQRWNFMPTKK